MKRVSIQDTTPVAKRWRNCAQKRSWSLLLFWSLGFGSNGFSAPVPSPEKLLPDDTLFLVTAPDFPRLRAIFNSAPQARIWDDPALKSFRDNFVAKWTEDIVKPLERDLHITVEEYANLAQGQFTIALTRNRSSDKDDEVGFLVLLDVKDKSSQLKSSLARLQKKWVESGKNLRTEKIRDFEFLILPLATNEAPWTFKQFFPHAPEVQQLGAENEPKKPPVKAELVIGRADSLLIIANSLKAAEKIVVHVTGGAMPALGDLATYQANHLALFRDAPLYAWLNVKAITDLSESKPADQKDAQAADPFPAVKPDNYLAASGLMGVKTIAFSIQNSNEGTLAQFCFTAPEASRQSLFNLGGGEPMDSSIPAFVPADAVKFQRCRLDGKKAWAAFEKLLAETSPQAFSGINAILDIANLNARQKDPTFDVRRNLIGNLGDDLITYGKVPRSLTPADLDSAPSITLLSSPNPEQFVAAFQSVLIFMSAQAEKPAEREFLGRKILSVPLPSLAIPFLETKPHPPRTVHYAASAGYVAISTDASMLEEFLRRSESQARPLRETAGLAEAAQKVTDPGTLVFGFENEAETCRAKFEELKLEAASATNSPPFNALPAPFGANPEKSVKDWMDFSLLPPFDGVSRYFHFTVYGVSANVEGFTFKYFIAAAPSLKTLGPTAASR